MAKHLAATTDRTIVSWLTPGRRKAIYGAVAAVLAALAAVGVITGEQSDAWAQVAEQALAVATLVLAALHTGGVYQAPVVDGDDDGDTATGGDATAVLAAVTPVADGGPDFEALTAASLATDGDVEV